MLESGLYTSCVTLHIKVINLNLIETKCELVSCQAALVWSLVAAFRKKSFVILECVILVLYIQKIINNPKVQFTFS